MATIFAAKLVIGENELIYSSSICPAESPVAAAAAALVLGLISPPNTSAWVRCITERAAGAVAAE